MDATIVIPVKNGGEKLKRVLAAIDAQQTDYTYEVICVDSGSRDDSVATIQAHNCTLIQIPPEEFGHGKTRNLGASKGTGRYILFVTQDATPADEHWLDEMVRAMDSDVEVAGAFGRHLPYEDCNYPDRLMLQEHFARFGDRNTVFELSDENRDLYEKDEGYRQYLAFFSDNNSCLRREVWEQIPYDDVDFAEDQAWARKILEAGYKKMYVPGAAVRHSHNYPLSEYKKRYFDEFAALYKVHHADFCPDFKSYIRMIYKQTRHECGFIKRQPELLRFAKLKWFWYSFRRNFIRANAAKRAVTYCKLEMKKKG